MLFTASAHAGLASGTITRTYRTWTRPQVKPGGRYRAGPVDLVVDLLGRVPLHSVSDADARSAGFTDRDVLVEYLAKRKPIDETSEVWRVDFHAVPRDVGPSIADDRDLRPEDIDVLVHRLDRLDAASAHGPWTRRVLALIDEHPGTVSTELARRMGRERAAFKVDVRKLKRLGLTISLDVGYQLSPRGEAFLSR